MATSTEEIARVADLDVVRPDALPIRRIGRGDDTVYVDSDSPVAASERRRIEAMAVPPAWEDVRIARSDDAHILARGTDAEGRTQYLYHPRFRSAADRLKFARLAELGERLATLRRAVEEAFASDAHAGTAAVVRLLDATAMRVGSARYASKRGTFGASTLQRRHVRITDRVATLEFTAKGGIDRHVVVTDDDLVDHIEQRCRQLRRAADPIFCGPNGGQITGGSVGRAMSEWSGMSMTAKELRTWCATAAMVEALLEPDPTSETCSDDPVLAAYDAVAGQLGNTRDVARAAYVAPAVVDAFADGRLERAWKRSRRSARHTRAEQTLRKVLAE